MRASPADPAGEKANPAEARRAGFVALLGAPNVGKSTLLNQLVGTKVSIVSPKVQTTRRRIIGISIVASTQIMFVDTPGIFAPRRRLDRAMVDAAWSGAADADLVCLLIDAARGIRREEHLILDGLARTRKRCLLVVNKVDLIKRTKLLPLVAELNRKAAFDATFMISALSGDGCAELMDAVVAAMPEGPWLFPEDQLSDLSNRAMAAEITREQLYHQLHQELPYAATVETEGWAEAPDGGEVRIDQTIYVQRDTQKAIVLGKRGSRIKEIGEKARHELEALLDMRVHLFLFVKVREDWTEDRERYREMGLDFPKG
ncbi:MAG: GTPase Era [Geminicoccaceae bacterium]|nr:GTPase Era [Geminicoccaceae bacterium]